MEQQPNTNTSSFVIDVSWSMGQEPTRIAVFLAQLHPPLSVYSFADGLQLLPDVDGICQAERGCTAMHECLEAIRQTQSNKVYVFSDGMNNMSSASQIADALRRLEEKVCSQDQQPLCVVFVYFGQYWAKDTAQQLQGLSRFYPDTLTVWTIKWEDFQRSSCQLAFDPPPTEQGQRMQMADYVLAATGTPLLSQLLCLIQDLAAKEKNSTESNPTAMSLAEAWKNCSGGPATPSQQLQQYLDAKGKLDSGAQSPRAGIDVAVKSFADPNARLPPGVAEKLLKDALSGSQLPLWTHLGFQAWVLVGDQWSLVGVGELAPLVIRLTFPVLPKPVTAAMAPLLCALQRFIQPGEPFPTALGGFAAWVSTCTDAAKVREVAYAFGVWGLAQKPRYWYELSDCLQDVEVAQGGTQTFSLEVQDHELLTVFLIFLFPDLASQYLRYPPTETEREECMYAVLSMYCRFIQDAKMTSLPTLLFGTKVLPDKLADLLEFCLNHHELGLSTKQYHPIATPAHLAQNYNAAVHAHKVAQNLPVLTDVCLLDALVKASHTPSSHALTGTDRLASLLLALQLTNASLLSAFLTDVLAKVERKPSDNQSQFRMTLCRLFSAMLELSAIQAVKCLLALIPTKSAGWKLVASQVGMGTQQPQFVKYVRTFFRLFSLPPSDPAGWTSQLNTDFKRTEWNALVSGGVVGPEYFFCAGFWNSYQLPPLHEFSQIRRQIHGSLYTPESQQATQDAKVAGVCVICQATPIEPRPCSIQQHVLSAGVSFPKEVQTAQDAWQWLQASKQADMDQKGSSDSLEDQLGWTPAQVAKLVDRYYHVKGVKPQLTSDGVGHLLSVLRKTEGYHNPSTCDWSTSDDTPYRQFQSSLAGPLSEMVPTPRYKDSAVCDANTPGEKTTRLSYNCPDAGESVSKLLRWWLTTWQNRKKVARLRSKPTGSKLPAELLKKIPHGVSWAEATQTPCLANIVECLRANQKNQLFSFP